MYIKQNFCDTIYFKFQNTGRKFLMEHLQLKLLFINLYLNNLKNYQDMLKYENINNLFLLRE